MIKLLRKAWERIYKSVIRKRLILFWLKSNGVLIGKRTAFGGFPKKLECAKHSVAIGNNCSIGPEATIATGPNGRIVIGDDVHIANNFFLEATSSITIENNAMISDWVFVFDHDHKIIKGEKLINSAVISMPVTIREGTWIGHGVTILKGVTVGRNCIIGACSVVTKDVPDNSVAVGSPCHVIKKR